MINKKILMAVSVSALLLSGCFNSETGASQRAANGEAETHAPAKHEAKKEAHVAEKATPAAEEAKAEEKAPAAEEAKAEEKAPAAEEAKAEEKAPAAEEAKAEEKAPAAEEAKAEEKAPATEAAPAAASATPDLGACKGCHGANFEKSAMGKSKIVKDLSKADVAKALKGYKDGSYGGAMKGLMKGQVGSFDDAAIDAIANAIGK